MASSKKTALTVAAGVFALGAGLGVATLASADPTPTPTPSGTASATQDPSDRGGHGGRHGKGDRFGDLPAQLASKLGVDEAKVTTALQEYRDETRPTTKPDPTTRPDPAERDAALAKALAGKLGVDEAKVTTALEEIRAARQSERAAALKDRLDAAVKAGTLTQAEADAVTKAVEKGVIGGGR